jgi:hypothetical protein
MGNKKGSSSKLKEVLVDEEEVLKVIENQEFIAMRTAKKIWPSPTTMEDQLRELASDGLIQHQGFAEWKTPGEHQVPFPSLGEIVLFVSFIQAGLCHPASPFLHRFLQYFGISLNHLTPNVVLHLSMFVHFCESFLGILPSISLFCYFFHLKPHPRSDNTSILGGCVIQFRQGRKREFFDYHLVDSVKEWHSELFYARILNPPLAVHSNASHVVNDRWEKLLLTSEELNKIKSLFKRIKTPKQQGLTSFGIVASYLRR